MVATQGDYRNMLKGIGLLFAWFITIFITGSIIGVRTNIHPYPQPIDLLILACVPLGAYHAAQYRMPELFFLLYGMVCSSLFVLDVLGGDAGPYRRGGAWSTTKADDWNWTLITCLVTVGLGLACRFAAQWRWDREYARSNKDLCDHCGYSLVGNVSGVCPECGNPTRRGIANYFVGKSVIVEMNRFSDDGTVLERADIYGEIVRTNPDEGIVIKPPGNAGELIVPLAVATLRKAKPGQYRLRPTGEQVVDPGFTIQWDIIER